MNNRRISKLDWVMQMALLTGQRSTCLRRQVGCVLVDKDFFVLATGYNGVPAGVAHCNQRTSSDPSRQDLGVYGHACPGAVAASGTNLDGCHALHAEWNALIRCRDPREIYAAFVSSSPCMTCTKMLMNTGCRKIFFREIYAHPEAEALWEKSRGPGNWTQVP